jgi:hypothetical protein
MIIRLVIDYGEIDKGGTKIGGGKMHRWEG